MKTLVIHPKDSTTEFLNKIYKDKDWTIINHPLSRKDMKHQIKNHDRIIMMGHGSPYGLLGHGYHINATIGELLRTKKCICIWCNADVFVKTHKLKGFYTGMFISEVSEAKYFNINANQNEIDYSNNLFVDNLKDIIDSPDILNEIKSSYTGNSLVIQYNNERLYQSI